MPMITTFNNTIFAIRCSKCKRTQENEYFQQNGRVFKTCNECRDRYARRRMRPVFRASLNPPRTDTDTPIIRRIPDDTDTSNDDTGAVVHARVVRGIQYRPRNYLPPVYPTPDYLLVSGATRHIPDSDTDDDGMNAALLLSSSAAAASSSPSAGYSNCAEPEPEPEPDVS